MTKLAKILRHFDILETEGEPTVAQCHICSKELIYDQRGYSNLKRHRDLHRRDDEPEVMTDNIRGASKSAHNSISKKQRRARRKLHKKRKRPSSKGIKGAASWQKLILYL